MKTKLLLIASSLALYACQQEEPSMACDPAALAVDGNSHISKNRSIEEAIEIAVNAAQTCDRSRSRAAGRTATAAGVKVITDAKSRGGESDSLLYVVNFDDDKGFVLVPVPRTDKEVLAIVDEGVYDPAVGTDNPGFNLYLDAANNYIRHQRDNGGISPQFEITPAIIYKTVIVTIAEYGNFHRLGELAWGQRVPYNKYTPNGYTGCAPTAMAMIIAGIGSSKTRLEYTFPEKDTPFENVEWINLIYHKRNSSSSLDVGHICYSPDREASHNSIARLMRQIGVVAGSVYYTDGSGTGTYPWTYESTLKFFLPDRAVTSLTDYKSDQVTKILDWGFLLMRANSHEGGHAWVAEGYHFLKTDKMVMEYNPDNKTWRVVTHDIKVMSVTYFNWGWNGLYNGFYEGSVFEPYDGNSFYDPQYVGVSYIH